MAVREILKMGHPTLKMISEPVSDPTAPEIAAIARDLEDTLDDIERGAIAAPQIGEAKRIVVYRQAQRFLTDPSASLTGKWSVLVNPVITLLTEDRIIGWELCLSIPGLHGKVSRHSRINLSYQTLDGGSVSEDMEGDGAVMVQHECDHLDGILYPMRMTDLSLLEFNTVPGAMAEDAGRGVQLWPPLQEMVDRWRQN
ncbi:MAG: peptide deformylase [Rhodospirillaceae bacterium]|jgi:peptide deformylase|nr:peptide deformylase [Rhodospirillaceae bacterium]MBT3887236.1 peptide deformylase [Rhodospirillaceae bacterium]MBT4117805.1 peptide deformylase [Rhodospirillaceae bacterium]MBT4672517.1 peptide deformylase [Rhodospirillaceae bacterium]MBT4717760.1 peptide deformylase [Rhodospirillaceae bacterium]